MYYIKIPEDIVLRDQEGNPILIRGKDGEVIGEAPPANFLRWLKTNVLVDQKLGKSSKDILAASDVIEKVGKAEDKQWEFLELTDSEWSMLKPVVEEPSGGYNPAVAVQLTPFLRAFLNAPTEDPRKQLKVAAD